MTYLSDNAVDKSYDFEDVSRIDCNFHNPNFIFESCGPGIYKRNLINELKFN